MSGLYIHIPFCRAKCAYCDFFSTPRRHDSTAYVDAVIAEYEARRSELPDAVRTVYFGGGTPSSLPPDELRRLVRHFAALTPEEFTVEVNPEDVGTALARMLADEGVNRISMGVQSLVDAELAAVGRRHTAARALDAVATLRRAGCRNLCLDLIYGLPGQNIDSWRHSLEGVLALRPEHLSCYALAFEQGTRLWAMRECGKVTEASQELSDAMYRILCSAAAAHGYEHYEIANFALPGCRSRHNSAYWNFTPYLGIGPGAHSFDGTMRRYNHCKIKEYIAAPATFSIVEEETPTERLNDYVMTALRTSDGIDLSFVADRFGDEAARRLRRLSAADCRYNPTPRGFRIAEESWLLGDALTIPLLFD